MKVDRRLAGTAAALLALSAVIYGSLFAVFGSGRDILFYLIHALGFLPIQLLLVTLIVDRLLGERERRAMLKKLNMVIGAFYSEVGTRLLRLFTDFDPATAEMAHGLVMKSDWSDADFQRALTRVSSHGYSIDSLRGDLAALKSFLVDRREFLLRLLENPNLLEHESFTELLWAVFHLTEELDFRDDLVRLSDADRAHLEGDVQRAYSLLVVEWLRYMKHLRADYPYLFSLALRTNPFDAQARVELE